MRMDFVLKPCARKAKHGSMPPLHLQALACVAAAANAAASASEGAVAAVPALPRGQLLQLQLKLNLCICKRKRLIAMCAHYVIAHVLDKTMDNDGACTNNVCLHACDLHLCDKCWQLRANCQGRALAPICVYLPLFAKLN